MAGPLCSIHSGHIRIRLRLSAPDSGCQECMRGIIALLILYPVCRWFADLKQRRRDAWLSYL
jgi:hypothetical protein